MVFINKAYGNLEDIAKAYKLTYQEAEPYPNIFFRNFFNEEILQEVVAEFEMIEKKHFRAIETRNERRNILSEPQFYGEKTNALIYFLHSKEFLNFLKTISDIEETLMVDPYFDECGLQETPNGGYLKVHTDFNKHHLSKLDKRLSINIYLNKNWRSEYSGQLELWDENMKECIKKIEPEFNTMALFSTTDFSYHGVPKPLNCPPSMSRKAISLFYYTNGRPAHEVNDGLNDFSTMLSFRSKKEGSKSSISKLFKGIFN
jgi:Rps23 Pro-64 3,4-dihydroxylase Tpa1-like proline 4-hydroxylase